MLHCLCALRTVPVWSSPLERWFGKQSAPCGGSGQKSNQDNSLSAARTLACLTRSLYSSRMEQVRHRHGAERPHIDFVDVLAGVRLNPSQYRLRGCTRPRYFFVNSTRLNHWRAYDRTRAENCCVNSATGVSENDPSRPHPKSCTLIELVVPATAESRIFPNCSRSPKL